MADQVVIQLRPAAAATELDLRDNLTASALVHLAFLLLLTFILAVRALAMPATKIVIPVRLLGPLTQPVVGGLGQPNVAPAVDQGRSPRQRLDRGRTPTPRPEQHAVRPHPTPAAPKPRTVRNRNVGANVLPAPVHQPVTEPQLPAALTPTETTTNRNPQPFVRTDATSEVAPFDREPSLQTPTMQPLSGDEMGEPLPLDVPAPVAAGPVTDPGQSGSGAVSGVSDGTGSGIGEVSLAGIESLAGGAETVAPPRVISRELPEYPLWAREKHLRGTGRYKVLITESGTVGEVEPMMSTLNPRLYTLGATALRRWVFAPVMVAGEPKPTWVTVTMQFNIQG